MSIGENVDHDLGTPQDGGDDLGGMTPEEQAQFDQLSRGERPEGGNEPEPQIDDGDDDAAGEGDIDHSGDGDEPAHGEGEPPQEKDAGQEKPKGKPRVVGYGKYEREMKKLNERAAALEKERDEARGQHARVDERVRMLMEAINTKQQPQQERPQNQEPEDPEPNADEDPFAHAAWTRRELGRTQEQFKQFRDGQQTREQQQQARSEEETLLGSFVSDIQRAAQTNPEMQQAFQHMRDSRYTELGYLFAGIDINDPEQCATLTPQQQNELSQRIQKTFEADALEVTRVAQRAGQSPAQHVFNLARARGFAPKPAQQQEAAPAARANGRAPAANGAAAAAAPSVTEQLASMRENQLASKSLSDAGGSPGGELTPERLLQMSDEEFEELHDSLSKNQFDRLMGKPRQ